MPSENQYSKAVLPLKGGLDFVDEALDANRGTLSDCLNYEVSDRLGYSRINGYERYDQGAYNSSNIYTNTVLLIGPSWNSYTIGEEIRLSSAGYKGKIAVIGTLVGTATFSEEDTAYLGGVVLVTNYEAFLSLISGVSDLVGVTSAASGTFTFAVSYVDTSAATQTAALNDLFYEDQLTVTAPNMATDGTKNGPITGLKWYKENLYAITDFLNYSFDTGVEEVFAGDVLTDASTGTTSSRVVSINVTSGSWSGGDAAGTVSLKLISGVPTGAQEVLRGNTGAPTTPTALTLTDTGEESSTNAGLFRTTEAGGWEEVDIGYEFAFADGTTNGPPPVFARGEGNASVVPATSSSSCTAVATSGTWTPSSGTLLDSVTTDDTVYASYTLTSPSPAAYLQVRDFTGAVAVPDSSAITGISLKISVTGEASAGGPYYPYVLAQPFDGTGQIGTGKSTPSLRESASGTTFGAADEYVIGGPNDTWGIADLKAALANGFGFNLAPRRTGSINNIFCRINYVELTVYYTANISTYYFWDGTDDVLAPITNYYVDDGDWTTDDAHGFIQVASITPYGTANRTFIKASDEIRTAPAGGGSLIARVESNAQYAYLPPLPALQDENSRYQLRVANFYGNEEWESIYGVSGAGQAFVYDGYYFRHIYTGLAPDLDTPRHVAYNQGALALGYVAGNVTFSVQGNPENFSGVFGATSIDLGDPVTGLVRMSGTALGVFCRSSTNTITGTNIDNYSSTVISGAEGAIEYTAVDIGQPLFCSNKGISLIDQTAAYGGFLGGRLSQAITPWLLPRVQRTRNPLPTSGLIFTGEDLSTYSSAVGVLFATVSRSKNQYRLYFEDGTCLTMTLQGAAREPAFTLQKYDKWTMTEDIDDAEKYSAFLPLAATSDIDDQGREHIFMSHYASNKDSNAGATLYHAYEFDNSWSFAGHPIPHSLRLNENFFGDVFSKNKLAKAAVHGLSYGYAPLLLSVGTEYGQPGTTARESLDISLPRTPNAVVSNDLESVMNINDPSSRGRSFNFKLFYPLTGDGVVSPPFSVQMLLLQYIEGKGDV